MRAVAYARLSTDRDENAPAIDRQLGDIAGLVERKGYDLVADPFIDRNVSAYSGKPRPAFRRMLQTVEADRVEAVVVWHLDRLYRSPRELEDLIDLVQGRGLIIDAATAGAVDLSTSDGQAMARVGVAIARKSSDDTRRRVMSAKAAQREAGGWQGGGRRPYGYRIVGGKAVDGEAARIEVDPTERDIIRGMVEAALGGRSAYAIAADLNARGIPTAGGNRWRAGHVTRLLTSDFVAGQLPNGKAGSWPRIIEPAERAVFLAKRAGSKTGEQRPARRGMLSGIARCGSCGAKMVASGGYYRCDARSGHCGRVSIKAETLDAPVLRQARETAAMLEAVGTDPAAAQARDEAVAELADVRTRLDALGVAFADGDIDGQQLRVASDRLKARQAELEAAIRTTAEEDPLALTEDEREALENGTGHEPSEALVIARRETIARLLDVVVKPGRGGKFEDRVDVRLREGVGAAYVGEPTAADLERLRKAEPGGWR